MATGARRNLSAARAGYAALALAAETRHLPRLLKLPPPTGGLRCCRRHLGGPSRMPADRFARMAASITAASCKPDRALANHRGGIVCIIASILLKSSVAGERRRRWGTYRQMSIAASRMPQPIIAPPTLLRLLLSARRLKLIENSSAIAGKRHHVKISARLRLRRLS